MRRRIIRSAVTRAGGARNRWRARNRRACIRRPDERPRCVYHHVVLPNGLNCLQRQYVPSHHKFRYDRDELGHEHHSPELGLYLRRVLRERHDHRRELFDVSLRGTTSQCELVGSRKVPRGYETLHGLGRNRRKAVQHGLTVHEKSACHWIGTEHREVTLRRNRPLKRGELTWRMIG